MPYRSPLVPRGQGRDELIASALRLIGRVGVNGVRMREVADGAGLSLGSASYHFTKRPNLIKAALDYHVERTEFAVFTALDARPLGGVREGLIALFGDRDHVLARHELHLEAARSTTHRRHHNRSRAAVTRLVAAAVERPGQSSTAESVQTVVTLLEETALTAAVRYRADSSFLRAMTEHLDTTLLSDPHKNAP